MLGALDVLWTFDLQGTSSLGVPALAPDGTVYVTSYNAVSGLATLESIGPDGKPKWAYQAAGVRGTSASIGSDATAHFAVDSRLYAVRPDGSLAWSFDVGGWIDKDPAIGADGTLYVGTFFDQGLVAISPTGTEQWRFNTEGDAIQSPIVGPDRTVYVVNESGTLFAVTPNGTEKWRYETAPWPTMQALAMGADGTILLPMNSLHAVGPDGRLKWISDQTIDKSGAYVSSAPVVGFREALRFENSGFDLEPWTINIGQGTADLTGFPVAQLAEIDTDTGAVSQPRVIILNGAREFILSNFQLNTAPGIALHPNKPVPQARTLPSGGNDINAFKDYNRAGGILYAPSGNSLYALTKDRNYYVGDSFTPPADDGVNLFGSPMIGVDGRVYVVAAINGGHDFMRSPANHPGC